MSTTLASLATPSAAPQSRLLRGVRQVFRGFVVFGKAVANRRRVTEMLELDDRMLRDIGIERRDLLGALSGPLAHDPSVILRLRSVDHRARRRALQFASDGLMPVRQSLEDQALAGAAKAAPMMR